MADPNGHSQDNPFQEQNPYLAVAAEAALQSLSIQTADVLAATDAMAAHTETFLRAAAAAPPKEVRDLIPNLKNHFGKDFQVNRWKKDVAEARARLAKESGGGMILTDGGALKSVLANAITELRQSPLDLRWDKFSNRMAHAKDSPWETSGEWRDLDDIRAAEYLQRHGIFVDPKNAHNAALTLAHEREFHPVLEYLENLGWDQQERLSHWLPDCLGAINNEYSRGVGKLWMISAVARIFNPGCKADQMLVLEGEQGKLKSSALRVIANGHMDTSSGVQWFSDTMPDINHKDIGLHLQGTWIIEMSDLDAIRKADWTATKRFISMQDDRFRSPYGYNVEVHPRQCVFAGSTNEEQWIGDRTGGRRFWAVKVGRVNLGLACEFRDQLWAEAVWRYQHGEQWHADEAVEGLARGEQTERTERDAWVDKVDRFLKNPHPSPGTGNGFHSYLHAVDICDVMESGIGLKPGEWRMADQKRVRQALRGLGWRRIKDAPGEWYEPSTQAT